MKNKVLSILAIFITFITLSCKTDLIEKETTPQGKGLISIKIGNNAKMLSPNTDNIYISSISSWTVTFTNKQDTTKRLQRSTSIGTLKEYLPFGTYIIEIEGITQSATDDSPAIAFYGKTEAAISPEEKTTTANIYVAPKKSENGTGSFEYIITLKESDFSPAENSFSAKLSSINNNSAPIVITTTAEKNETETYTTYTITFTNDEIPSGYYTLTISCATIPNPNNPISITQILQKNILVEICDNAKTSDSIELQVEDYKTLYAVTPTADDGNKYANYSGEFKQYPADFLNILNNDTITFAEIYMLNGNIPIINPSKIKDKTFYICLYNESDPEDYGYIDKNYDETALSLYSTKGLMLLGNDNHQESILNLTIYTDDTAETTTQVTLLNGSPSIYLSSYSSSKFEFNINETSNYHDKPFIQYDSEEEEYLLRIFDDEDYTTITSFDGITLKGNDGNDKDKVVYTSIPQPLNDKPSYKIQYFILPKAKGTIPEYTINANKTDLYIDEKVKFTIDGNFTPDTKFKWYANRKLVQDSTDTSYTHTAQFTTDEVLCFIYQDENNYTTVNATEQINLNVTKDKTPIALYSAVSNPGFYYLYKLTLTDVKNISKGISSIHDFSDIDNDTFHIDNCYGNNDTLWWVTDSGIYNSKNVSLEMPNLRYIDFDTDTLSLYATGMDASYIIYKITGNNETYSYDTLFYIDNPITCITFHNDYCYTIEEVSYTNTETQYTLKKYNISNISPTATPTADSSEILLTKTTTYDDSTGEETTTFTNLIFDNDNQIANTLKNPLFSDIQVTNEGIFVLFNDCYYKKDTDKPTIDANSRGGIIKFTNDLKLDKTFGSNGIFGWTNNVYTSYGTNNNTTYTITSYMPDFPTNSTQLSTEYFYSPRKFLAIKPKKLIFADDGFMFYGNNDDTSSKDVNQLIEFDIEKAMFDSYNLDLSIDFNKRAKGTGSVAASFYWDN